MAMTGRGLLPTLSVAFASFLDRVNDGASGNDPLDARNAVLDERVTAARAADYAASGAAEDHRDSAAWRDAHNRYLTRHVALPWANSLPPMSPRHDAEVAATFRPGAGDDAGPSNDLLLLRMVRFPRSVDVPVNYSGFAAALRRVAGAPSPVRADIDTVNAGLHLWDSGRASTLAPRWAGLWMEARELFGDDPGQDDPQWANRLRSRLGLSHRPVPVPVEVVLFRYYVRDLPSAAWSGNRRLVTAPSLLDGWLYPYFCPAPPELDTGRAVNLEALGDAPNREYLHAPIQHTAANVFRVGTIDADPPAELSDARRVHLDRVRAVSRRSDYGRGTDS
ncbi:MAG TPA: hypothetical protein VF715_15735 [Thermoleophilaceae bacterium]|jgi:hypothetical protein